MIEKERNILKKAIDSNEGLISPATMINSYAHGDQRSVEILVSRKYLERVYEFKEGTHGATYSIIFYTVTEKGLIQFDHFAKRLWFNFKNHITIWVGIFSIFFGITSLIFVYLNNQTTQNDIQTRNRPYIGMEKVDRDQTKEGLISKIFLINTGNIPANNVALEIYQFDSFGVTRPVIFPLNNTSILMPSPDAPIIFPITFKNIDDFWGLDFTVKYDGISIKNYITNLRLQFHKNSGGYDIISGFAQ